MDPFKAYDTYMYRGVAVTELSGSHASENYISWYPITHVSD